MPRENDISFFRRVIIREGKKLFTPYPWRKTKNHFHALTAEIMLQRTGADQVADVYSKFITKYKSPDEFLKNCRVNIFKNLGLTWRYQVFRKMCKELTKLSEIPEEKEELLKLPGVGEYVAGAYRSLHLNKKDYIIDSNVVRIYGRFFNLNTDGEVRRKEWFIEFTDRITPEKNFKDYNYSLLDFTRNICRPKPLCEECGLKKKCYLSCTWSHSD